jgi:hypothetical protein
MRCKTNALIEFNHGADQRAYVDWKYSQLANLVGTPPKLRNGNGGRIAYRFTTRSLAELTPFYRAFYSTGRKVVPEVDLTPLTLAVWFMDDGSKSYRAIYLNTQQFDLESQGRLVGLLATQWSIRATLNRARRTIAFALQWTASSDSRKSRGRTCCHKCSTSSLDMTL